MPHQRRWWQWRDRDGYGGSWPGHLPGNCVIWMLIPAIHVLVFVQTAHTIPKCLARPRICLGLPLCLFFPSSLVHFACEMATSLNLLTIFGPSRKGIAHRTRSTSGTSQVYLIREFSISSFRPYGGCSWWRSIVSDRVYLNINHCRPRNLSTDKQPSPTLHY